MSDNNEGRIIQEGVIDGIVKFDVEIQDIFEGLTPEDVAKNMGDFSPPTSMSINSRAAGDVMQYGNFTGGTSSSQIYTKIYWSQRESDTSGYSTIIADLYFYTMYGWYGNAQSGSYLSISGNKKTFGSSLNVGGTGERKVMSHSIHRTSNEGTVITIEGGVQINGTYGGVYYGTIVASKNITLLGPAKMNSCVKTGGSTWTNIKEFWVKTGSTTWTKGKELWVKTSSTGYTKAT